MATGLSRRRATILFDKSSKRRNLLKRPSPHYFIGNLDLKMLLDARNDQQDVERIKVQLAADQRHVVGDVRRASQLQIAAQNRFHFVQELGVGHYDSLIKPMSRRSYA